MVGYRYLIAKISRRQGKCSRLGRVGNPSKQDDQETNRRLARTHSEGSGRRRMRWGKRRRRRRRRAGAVPLIIFHLWERRDRIFVIAALAFDHWSVMLVRCAGAMCLRFWLYQSERSPGWSLGYLYIPIQSSASILRCLMKRIGRCIETVIFD